jgi:Na+/melibiose symporter-like transporter
VKQPTATSPYRDAWAVTEFRFVVAAHAVSVTGGVVAQVALVVLIYMRTSSALLSALAFTVSVVPHLVAATWLSALAVRWPVRRLLVGCNIASAGLAAVMAVPGTPVSVLLCLGFAAGLVQPVFAGARSAVLPDVLPGPAYVPGRSLLRLVSQATQIAGFAVGGTLLAVVSPSVLLVANAGAFAGSAMLLRFGTLERRIRTERPEQATLLRDSMTGLRAVLRLPALRRVLLLGWIVPAVGVAPEALAVPYAEGIRAGPAGAGLLMAATALGAVLGEVLATSRLTPAWQLRLIGPAAVTVLAPLLLFAFQPGLVPATLILAVSGLGFAMHIGLDRRLLDVTPVELRARALSIQTAGLMFWQGVGFAAAGAAAELMAPWLVVPAAALAGLLAVALLTRPVRRPRDRARSAL